MGQGLGVGVCDDEIDIFQVGFNYVVDCVVFSVIDIKDDDVWL